jgi:hypothetical protein
MALNKGYPDPQLTMHKHLVHSPVWRGVGKPLSCTRNSLDEELWLCSSPTSQGWADLLLIRFQQPSTISFFNTENVSVRINMGIYHVNILCSLPGMGCILSTVCSSSHNQEVNLDSKGWECAGLKEKAPLTATKPEIKEQVLPAGIW